MAAIVVVGSVARDEVAALHEPLREGAHLEGEARGSRLGGGGANTAVALARAGHRAILVAPLGTDALGDELLAELAASGVETSAVRRVPGASTWSLVLVTQGGERTIVNLNRTHEPEPPRRLLSIAADCLYVRSRALDLAPLLAEKAQGCLVVAHMPPLEEGSRPAQVLVASQSDLPPADLADPFATGFRVAGNLLEWVVVTRGPEGATAHGPQGLVLTAAAPHVETVDSTGAGDAFAAGLVHALTGGHAMGEALGVACRWGAEAVRWPTSALPAEAVARLGG
ncbi:MAG: carbohydrate kinase family protein [Magnetospirillum sp. WYHS-4]